jgi:thiosulfate dehydrogenase
MIKGLLYGIALTVCLGLVIAYVAVQSGFVPANADASPGPLETWMASTSLRASLQRQAPSQANPVADNELNLLEGVRLFATNCAVCHGSAQGKAAASPIARGLYQKPPQFANDGVEDDPEGETFWKVKHGIRLTGMPSFAATLTDREIWTLALFLKHMDKLPPGVQHAWEQVRNWPPQGGSSPSK